MRALVLGVGGLRGAYDAGVATALCRELGNTYFDAIYMSSVGVFAGTFFAANQPDVIEHTWRNYVSGKQLVNYINILKGKNILNTEYLIEIFKNKKAYLNVKEVFCSGIKLHYVLEELATGKAVHIQPVFENIFELMLAATAVPIIHQPVTIGETKFIDGSLADPLPFKRALSDGHKEIVVIYNKSKGYYIGSKYKASLWLLSLLVPPVIRQQMRALEKSYKIIDEYLESRADIVTIRPDFTLPLSILETNTVTLNKLFDSGLKDGLKFVELKRNMATR